MKRYIRIIHINGLSKKEIFETYSKLDDYKYYDLASSGVVYLSHEFWDIVKKYCITDTLDKLRESPTIPISYENFVLVNVSDKETSGEHDEFAFADIPYLLAFLFQLNDNYTVCFYNDNLITDTKENYFRLSYFLNIWAAQSAKIRNIKYLEVTKAVGEETFNPKGLAYSFGHDTPADTLLPIISLTQKMYQCLEKPYRHKDDLSLNKLLKNMKKTYQKRDDSYKYYEEYIYQVISKMINYSRKPYEWREKEEKFFKSAPTLIVVYIYAMIVRYIPDDELINIGFEAIIERCFDYSQGLMQLLENSIKHVVNVEKQSCAYFSIRMHHKPGALNEYLQSKKFKKLKYFLEISVIDCCKTSGEVGIVSKYNQSLITKGFTSISGLNDIFENSKALKEYYSDVSNVSNHYGLQIFDTVLTSNHGLFIVKSGDNISPHIYTNAHKVYYENERVYKDSDNEKLSYEHFCGTNYTIILPINKNKNKSVPQNLSLGNVPLSIDDGFECVEAETLKPIKLTSGLKETFIEQYIEKIKSLTSSKVKQDISYLSKKRIVAFSINEISKSRPQLELLCKAIFSFIASNNDNISVVCLLDVEDEFKLLEIARTIALFYDKSGNCQFMKDKGIYIASADNEYDILFTGDNIESVIENIERQRLMKSLPDFYYNHIFYALTGKSGEESFNE